MNHDAKNQTRWKEFNLDSKLVREKLWAIFKNEAMKKTDKKSQFTRENIWKIPFLDANAAREQAGKTLMGPLRP